MFATKISGSKYPLSKTMNSMDKNEKACKKNVGTPFLNKSHHPLNASDVILFTALFPLFENMDNHSYDN